MLKKVNHQLGEDKDLQEYHELLDKLALVEEDMNAADWMLLTSEWNQLRIKATGLRKHIGNIKKTLSE